MAVETADDRAELLSDFGETFVAPGGATFTGIFDAESAEELGVRVSGPSVLARHADVQHIPIDTATVSIWRQAKGTRYVIRDIVADGIDGFDRLVLELDQ